jgi:hypothetical protein
MKALSRAFLMAVSKGNLLVDVKVEQMAYD